MLSKDKKLVIFALVGAMIVLVVLFGVIGEGFVRQSSIYLPEIIRVTIAFENIDGEVKIVGVEGTSEVNPTLVARTDYTYEITVLNRDSSPHTFYVDGLDIQTRELPPDSRDVIRIYSLDEGRFNYYDGPESKEPLGEIKIVKVGLLNQYP